MRWGGWGWGGGRDSVCLEDWNLDVCICYMDSVFLFCFLLLPLFKFNVASRPQRP